MRFPIGSSGLAFGGGATTSIPVGLCPMGSPVVSSVLVVASPSLDLFFWSHVWDVCDQVFFARGILVGVQVYRGRGGTFYASTNRPGWREKVICRGAGGGSVHKQLN